MRRARSGSGGKTITEMRSGGTPRSSTIRSRDTSESVRTWDDSRAAARKNIRFASRDARDPPCRSGIVSWITVIDRPGRSGRIWWR